MWLVLSVYLGVFFFYIQSSMYLSLWWWWGQTKYGNEHVQGCTELSEVASSSLFVPSFSWRLLESAHCLTWALLWLLLCKVSWLKTLQKASFFIFFFNLTKLTADLKFPDFIHKWKRSQNNISCRNLLLVVFQLKT